MVVTGTTTAGTTSRSRCGDGRTPSYARRSISPRVNETPLCVIFGLAFVLFLSGYAFLAALFPEVGTSTSATAADDTTNAERDTTAPQPKPGITAAAAAHDDSSEPLSDRSALLNPMMA